MWGALFGSKRERFSLEELRYVSNEVLFEKWLHHKVGKVTVGRVTASLTARVRNTLHQLSFRPSEVYARDQHSALVALDNLFVLRKPGCFGVVKSILAESASEDL